MVQVVHPNKTCTEIHAKKTTVLATCNLDYELRCTVRLAVRRPIQQHIKRTPGLKTVVEGPGGRDSDDGDLVLGREFFPRSNLKLKTAPMKQIEVFLAGWVTEKL